MGDMRERLLPVFLEEASENLGNIEKCLETLGKVDDEGQDLLEPAFRSAHTIKGTAALVKLTATSTIARRLEDALEALNLTGNIPSSIEVKALKFAFDRLKALVGCAAERQPEPPEASEEVDRVFLEAEKTTPRPSFSVTPEAAEPEEVLPFKLPVPAVPPAADREEPSEEVVSESEDEPVEEELEVPDEEEQADLPPLLDDDSPRVAIVGFSCCHFQVGGVDYYLPIENMLEISPLPNLTYLPMSPDYILGLANLRGNVVPVIHLGRLRGNYTPYAADKHLIVSITGNEKVGFVAEGMPDLAMETRGERIDPHDFIQRHKVGAA